MSYEAPPPRRRRRGPDLRLWPNVISLFALMCLLSLDLFTSSWRADPLFRWTRGIVLLAAVGVALIWLLLRLFQGPRRPKDGGLETGDRAGAPLARRSPTSLLSDGTLGVGSGTFSGAEVGCLGATVLALLTVLAILGLLAMAWWPTLRK